MTELYCPQCADAGEVVEVMAQEEVMDSRGRLRFPVRCPNGHWNWAEDTLSETDAKVRAASAEGEGGHER
ncbi:MAG TPA: hypothetical protein EYP55_00655 [Anaerolineae bacterium]|nr:hypothetical protein [Anaerolineae bacterium]